MAGDNEPDPTSSPAWRLEAAGIQRERLEAAARTARTLGMRCEAASGSALCPVSAGDFQRLYLELAKKARS